MLSCAAAIACVAVTSIGVYHLSARILAGEGDNDPKRAKDDDGNALDDTLRGVVDQGNVVTANIFVTAMAELAWSAFSIQVALKGARYMKIDFSSA